MEEPPDFVRIDKLVQEYLTYRQSAPSAPSAGDKLSPDDIVEKMMKYFDTGDYPNILYLWDTYVSERLDTADAHVVHEAGVAEFYMHIHCATCPFRQSSIRDMPNPGAAGKVAARAMTIFKHFVDTKGKSLAATPEFHVSISCGVRSISLTPYCNLHRPINRSRRLHFHQHIRNISTCFTLSGSIEPESPISNF